MLIGVVIGCFSGLYGGRVDMAIMRLVDIMIAIPFLIWVSLFMLVLKPGIALDHRSPSRSPNGPRSPASSAARC